MMLATLLAVTSDTASHLDVGCDECSSVHGYTYPRAAVHADWDCDDCHSTDWTCFNAAGNLRNFTYLETVQLVVETDHPSLRIRVGLQPGAALPPQYDHFSRFVKDDYSQEAVGPFPWGTELVVSVSAAEPVHMTLVPAASQSSVHDEERAYAIFISVRASAAPAEVEVRITDDLTWESARSEEAWAAASYEVSGCDRPFTRPSWSWKDGTLGYVGTLAKLRENCGERDVAVVLADGVTSSLPLSSSFVALQAGGGQELRAANSSHARFFLPAFRRSRIRPPHSIAQVRPTEARCVWNVPSLASTDQ